MRPPFFEFGWIVLKCILTNSPGLKTVDTFGVVDDTFGSIGVVDDIFLADEKAFHGLGDEGAGAPHPCPIKRKKTRTK